ncbi:MAG TPA: hypothetical protein VNQ31_07035, partial [Sphingomonadaceae bacterium]|nr:hypothetical protein [Sphingomonadaceae bacterium]
MGARILTRPIARTLLGIAGLAAAALLGSAPASASDAEQPVERDYSLVRAAVAPAGQSEAEAEAKSSGCVTCHTKSDQPTMHATPAVRLGCVDCHGGNAKIAGDAGLPHNAPAYVTARDAAHVLPRYPQAWHWPSSANPKRSYTLLNREAPEYIRFVNPSDYRVARAACGACHLDIIEAAERSLMSTAAMFWGGGSYNNGVLPYKNYMFGEAYTAKGEPAKVVSPGDPAGTVTEAEKARGALAALYPLPTWHVMPPADVFRVFERGGRNISSAFPEIGLPNIGGTVQRLEEPGRPDLKQSNRGPATGLRVAIAVLNIHKTRLNDPYMWFMGTNDQPGDYRHSGCAGCHVVYANDREPRHSLTYAAFGRDGQTQTADPTIAMKVDSAGEKERGHPLRHAFTKAIPTAQCMTCHMHQPNIFLNSYLGYTMWDYESDAPLMWPHKDNPLAPGSSQKYPTAAETHAVLERNPEGASPRGLWSDEDFLRHVYD